MAVSKGEEKQSEKTPAASPGRAVEEENNQNRSSPVEESMTDNKTAQPPVEREGVAVPGAEDMQGDGKLPGDPMSQGPVDGMQEALGEGNVESGEQRENKSVEESHEEDVLGDVLGDPVKSGDLQAVSDVEMIPVDCDLPEDAVAAGVPAGGGAEVERDAGGELPMEYEPQVSSEGEVVAEALASMAAASVEDLGTASVVDGESKDVNPLAETIKGEEELVQVWVLVYNGHRSTLYSKKPPYSSHATSQDDHYY